MSSRKYRAAALLVLVLATLPARAGEACVAASIDQVGRCFGKFAPVQRVIDRELRGIDPQAPVAPFDTSLLATQILGDFAIGEIAPIAGGRRNDWLFLIRRAKVDPEGQLVDLGLRGPERLAWIRYVPTASKTRMVEDASSDQRPVIELKAVAAVPALLPPENATEEAASAHRTFPDCVSPEANGGEEHDTGANYASLTGNFRWLRLSSKHRVLVAEVARFEGYAGGGGAFTGEVLLDVQDGGTLVPIACYAVSRYQMFGGDWNADGTRQHPESHAAWRLAVVPGGEWPNLRLRPTSRATPAAALVWDKARGRYVEALRRHKH